MSSIAVYNGRINTVEWTPDEIQVNLTDVSEPAVYRLSYGEIVLDDDTDCDVPCTSIPTAVDRFTRFDVLDALIALGLFD